jgi:hypothetical protein
MKYKIKYYQAIIQMNVPKNNNLFQRIILEVKGVKSNYFGEDLVVLARN